MGRHTDEAGNVGTIPRVKDVVDFVAFRAVAAIGALMAAIAPAVMATADGDVLRGSISAYWDVAPRYLFWAPFTGGAALLITDGILSFVSPLKADVGRRWYNIVLGVALLLLTWFDLEAWPAVHYPAAVAFFGLFIAVIAYTALLGWNGRHLPGHSDQDHVGTAELSFAKVSAVFLVLLVLTLVAFAAGIVSFFFFEVFALLNFALFYVQGGISPFKYNHYEFSVDWLNTVVRTLRIMRPN